MNADKEIMENLLNTVKGVCDLYMHGTIESSTQNVHAAFDDALEESLCMQNEIYNQMSQQGWYPMEQAPQQQIDKVRDKFDNPRERKPAGVALRGLPFCPQKSVERALTLTEWGGSVIFILGVLEPEEGSERFCAGQQAWKKRRGESHR